MRLRICTMSDIWKFSHEPLGENKWIVSFTAGPEVFEMFCAFTIFVVVFVILVRSAIRVLLSVRLFVRWINFCFARVRKENHFSLKTSQPLLCFYIPFTTQVRASFLRWDLPSTQSPKGNFAKWEEFWNFAKSASRCSPNKNSLKTKLFEDVTPDNVVISLIHAYGIFKFIWCNEGWKHLMCFQSETSVFKFINLVWTGRWWP